jgi:hypothetical protein
MLDAAEHDGAMRGELFGEGVGDGEGVIIVDVAECGRGKGGVIGRAGDAGRVREDEAGDAARERRIHWDGLNRAER